jgi:hypothetical protein
MWGYSELLANQSRMLILDGLASGYTNLAVVALLYLIADAEAHPLYDVMITYIHFSHAGLDLSKAFHSVLYI